MEERGMQNDPRYQQLMAMANRTKAQMSGMPGGPMQQGMGGMQPNSMSGKVQIIGWGVKTDTIERLSFLT